MAKTVQRYKKLPQSEIDAAKASMSPEALAPLLRRADGVASVMGLSGGKDSTAMALRWAELHPGEPMNYLCTPTGDEMPELVAHWASMEAMIGQPIIRLQNGTLNDWIERWKMLPNFRARWCTRVLKLVPAEVFARVHGDVEMVVGLRADEMDRAGLYSEDIVSVYPLREWGWGLPEVVGYLKARGVKVPRRTDCARCFYQRLIDWWRLWQEHPEIYQNAVDQESSIGHTFRSPHRDRWPAGLAPLREWFKEGRIPRGATAIERGQMGFAFGDDWSDDDADAEVCRACSL